MTRRSPRVAVILGLGLTACAHPSTSTTPQRAEVTSLSSSSRSLAASPEVLPTGRAYALLVQATSCWAGGLWSDALGERGDARDAGIRHRCDEVLRAAGESTEDAYYPLRALDSGTVDRIAQNVRNQATLDEHDAPHAAELVSFLRAIADASRETVHARRAADKVKQAFESVPSAADRRANKEAAAPELQASRALHALFAYDGPYAVDARAIALLHALDRLEIARGLPKHLKIYAVEGAFSDVFGVSAPQLSEDAAQPIPTGTWLAYLTKVAAAANHPVPPDANDPQNREPLAWNGVLEGFADRFRRTHANPALAEVIRRIVVRLDEQAKRDRAAFEAHAPRDR